MVNTDCGAVRWPNADHRTVGGTIRIGCRTYDARLGMMRLFGLGVNIFELGEYTFGLNMQSTNHTIKPSIIQTRRSMADDADDGLTKQYNIILQYE